VHKNINTNPVCLKVNVVRVRCRSQMHCGCTWLMLLPTW